MPTNKINLPNKKFIIYWVPVVGYATLIFILSSISGEKIPQLFKFQEVWAHIVEYAILAFLLNRAIKAYNPGLVFIRRFAWVFLLSFLYAASDELHQAFVPGRSCSLHDLLNDGIGIFITTIFYK